MADVDNLPVLALTAVVGVFVVLAMYLCKILKNNNTISNDGIYFGKLSGACKNRVRPPKKGCVLVIKTSTLGRHGLELSMWLQLKRQVSAAAVVTCFTLIFCLLAGSGMELSSQSIQLRIDKSILS